MSVGGSLLEPIAHTGPRSSRRILSTATATRTVWTTLRPGRRLVEGLDEAMRDSGASSAQVEILGGSFTRVSYCVPAAGSGPGMPVHYSEERSASAPVVVVTGAATAGWRDGKSFVHCHAAWLDADGALLGGHLWPDTWVGPDGVTIAVHALLDAEMTSANDPETHLPVFTPSSASGARPDDVGRRAVISRVCPGENLRDACAEVMREHDISAARIVGSLGSLVGAAMKRPSGVLLVDGPATEVVLRGHARAVSDGVEASIWAAAIDRDGRVHVGELADDNLVAVTLELFLEEDAG